jgi:predicted alpha/beta hydrolase family esterase
MEKVIAAIVTLGFVLGAVNPSYAQGVPNHAQGLKELLVVVDLTDTKKQAGVYSTKAGVDKPTKLAVLLPGNPSVVRPVVENGSMVSSKLTGNFLIRARRWLSDESIATLVVDCHSESSDECTSSYQASKERQQDVQKLINEVRKQVPSINEVWLVGTSMGTVSSAFMPTYDSAAYAGAIHTATITEPYAKHSYRELGGFDYKKAKIPQFFIHHKNDPCTLTTYSSAKSISQKFNLPLITVTGGSDFEGHPCKALTEHGFKGKEKDVMKAIAEIINTGSPSQLEIN